MSAEKLSAAEPRKSNSETADASSTTMVAFSVGTAVEPQQIRPGMTIRVHQKIVEKNQKGEEKKRIQVFQGIVTARKHGTEAGATITVRKISHGFGVERIFPLASPWIEKFEVVKQAKTRRSKLYFLKSYQKRLREHAYSK